LSNPRQKDKNFLKNPFLYNKNKKSIFLKAKWHFDASTTKLSKKGQKGRFLAFFVYFCCQKFVKMKMTVFQKVAGFGRF